MSGEIEVLEDLKRELFENYVLSIVASDNGTPSLSSSITIIVQVLFVNLTSIALLPVKFIEARTPFDCCVTYIFRSSKSLPWHQEPESGSGKFNTKPE